MLRETAILSRESCFEEMHLSKSESFKILRKIERYSSRCYRILVSYFLNSGYHGVNNSPNSLFSFFHIRTTASCWLRRFNSWTSIVVTDYSTEQFFLQPCDERQLAFLSTISQLNFMKFVSKGRSYCDETETSFWSRIILYYL